MAEKSVWDPLWEYVLNDYEEQEESNHRRKNSKSQKKKQQQATSAATAEDSSMFDFFGEESDGYESPTSRPQRNNIGLTRTSSKKKNLESRDEQDEASYATMERSTSRAPWRRNRSGRDGSLSGGDSLWDVIQGKPPGVTVSRASSGNRERAERAVKSQGQNKKSKNKKGRRKLFRRFRSERTIEEVSSEEEEDTDLEIKKRVKSQDSERKVAQTSELLKEKSQIKKSAPPQPAKKDDGFDPFSAFFSQFDPFVSDDSDSDLVSAETDNASEYTDEVTVLTEERTIDTNDGASELDEQTAASSINNFTEIRLKHSTQNGSLLDQETTQVRSQDDSISEEEEESLVGSIKVLEPHQLERSRETVGHERILEAKKSDSVSQINVDNTSFAFDEKGMVAPSTLICFKKEVAPDVMKQPSVEVPTQKKGLNRLVCRKDKNNDVYDPYDFDTAEWSTPTPGLPATRMISDGAAGSTAVVEQELEREDSFIGVSAHRLIETKGPQSLYAYDIDSKQHMDVMYAHYNQLPRSCIELRTLSAPPMLADFSNNDDRVIIQVEASTVSETDCIIRQGQWWGQGSVPLPNVPGVDVVGKICDMKQHTATQYGLKPYQRVLSLVKWGGNSRYVALPSSHLVKIPDSLDPAEAACLPETYMSAFQVLHFGQHGAARYRENSLRGKSILILGSMANNMGRAIIELALHAGAANVYATAKKKHWKTLISFGIMPLSQDPFDWIMRLEGTLDLVVASNGGLREDVTPTHFRALKESGHLILCGRRLVGNDVPVGDWKQTQTPIMCAKNKSLLKTMSRTHSYDVYEQWEKDMNTCKRDLVHLVQLLEKGVLKPNVLDRLPLTKVGKAQELLESKRLSGFLVCEPWLKTKKRAVYL